MTEQKNQLFVTDEDDEMNMQDSPEQLEVDVPISEESDPVIKEIPLNLSTAPFPLHLLQYPNKPKKLGKNILNHPPVAQARYRTTSSLWELDIPLNTEAFYDKNRAEEEWSGVAHQTLKGVSVENSGQYVGLVSNDQIYLLPVQKVAQMRPFFKYIDSTVQQRKQDDARVNQPANTAPKRAQVVTMSAKSTNEANQPRLGGSLLAHKIADEEESVELEWVENTYEQFKECVVSEESRSILKPVGDETDYLTRLM